MPHAYPELTGALAQMLDKIDTYLRDSGYEGPPVRMYLAGGLAVNYYCGSRYTEDVDASFSRRVVVRSEDLVIDYPERVNDFATPGDVNLVCGRRAHWWESSPQVGG